MEGFWGSPQLEGKLSVLGWEHLKTISREEGRKKGREGSKVGGREEKWDGRRK